MLPIYLAMIETEEDKDKFTLLYEKYRKLMFYVANQILKDDYLAEDAVHHTFIKIIENFDKISALDCHKTKSYVVTMVRNYSITLYHQGKNHPVLPLDEEPGAADDSFTKIDESDALARAVTMLPEIYQEILTLKYIQEFPNSVISEMLDISEPTVRKRLERAKEKIQQILEREENDNAS